MPSKARFPKPDKRYVNGAWNIFWRWNYRQYTISTGLTREKEDAVFADVALRQFALGLAKEPPDIPADYVDRPAATRYLADRRRQDGPAEDDNTAAMAASDWLADYAVSIENAVVPGWSSRSRFFLDKLDREVGGIKRVTPARTHKFLDDSP